MKDAFDPEVYLHTSDNLVKDNEEQTSWWGRVGGVCVNKGPMIQTITECGWVGVVCVNEGRLVTGAPRS